MKPEDLLLALGQLDDHVIEKAHRNQAYAHRMRRYAAAACLCLVFLGISALYLIPRTPEAPVPPAPVIDPAAPEPPAPSDILEPPIWTPYYNPISIYADGARRYIPGYFREALSAEELAAAAPPKHPAFGTWAGEAGFDGEGRLLEVFLWTGPEENRIFVTLIPSEGSAPHTLPENMVVSPLNGVDFLLSIYDAGELCHLDAEAQLENCRLYASLTVPADNLAAAKADFQAALACFTTYPSGSPDFSAVRAEVIPHWFNRQLTHGEALADPDFGRYFPGDVPEGFRQESICRSKNQLSDTLTGLWTKGCGEFQWTVSPFPDSDIHRQVKPSQRERYDLRLYPIPRADSVPTELREVVDNPIFALKDLTQALVDARTYTVEEQGDISGPRFRFSVRCGDVLISVHGKGADPSWVYGHLDTLRTALSSENPAGNTGATQS